MSSEAMVIPVLMCCWVCDGRVVELAAILGVGLCIREGEIGGEGREGQLT